MIMTLNEAVVKHNFITKVLLKSEDGSLSKELKVKIMTMRIELGKIRKEFEEDLQEFVKQIKTPEFEELMAKEDRTDEEEAKLKEMGEQIDSDYNAFVTSRGLEEVEFNRTLTDEEYFEIVEVNSDNDVEINGNAIPAPDFLEVLYSLFVA